MTKLIEFVRIKVFDKKGDHKTTKIKINPQYVLWVEQEEGTGIFTHTTINMKGFKGLTSIVVLGNFETTCLALNKQGNGYRNDY